MTRVDISEYLEREIGDELKRVRQEITSPAEDRLIAICEMLFSLVKGDSQ